MIQRLAVFFGSCSILNASKWDYIACKRWERPLTWFVMLSLLSNSTVFCTKYALFLHRSSERLNWYIVIGLFTMIGQYFRDLPWENRIGFVALKCICCMESIKIYAEKISSVLSYQNVEQKIFSCDLSCISNSSPKGRQWAWASSSPHHIC